MQKSKFNLTLQFILTFCILSCVPYLYFHSQFSQLETNTHNFIEQSNSNKLEFAKVELNNTLDKVTTSLRTLSNNGILNQYVTNPNKTNVELLKDFWLVIAKTQGYYSQLRFVDVQGMEKIRINSFFRVTEVVDSDRLQYKGSRDYFLYAQGLKQNEVGVFGIDYEVENGEPVLPLIPAYRIIYPITIAGQRQGYFIANLNLNRIYQGLAYKGNDHNLPTVIDQNGYFLMTRTGEQILGHLFENKNHHNLSATHPKLWRMIQLKDSGSIKENDEWISFVKTQVKGPTTYNKLTLLYKTTEFEGVALTNAPRQELKIQAVFILIIILLISFTFVTWMFNHEKNSLNSQIAVAAMNGMSAMVITDRNNKIIQVNDEFTRVSGYTLNEVFGESPAMFASGQHEPDFYKTMWIDLKDTGVWEGEVVNKRRDGSLITEILRIQTIKNRRGVVEYYVASFVDITHRKELENRLRTLSEKDSLTGLSNRRRFELDMQTQLQRTKRYRKNETATLALIDIDHFKRVNDHFGHDKGDIIIQQVANSLSSHLRETDMISRIGGEEFAAIMPHTQSNEAYIVLNRLLTAINLENELAVTVSIGFSEISSSVAQTYKRADTALYESKASGRNCVNEFSLSDSESIA